MPSTVIDSMPVRSQDSRLTLFTDQDSLEMKMVTFLIDANGFPSQDAEQGFIGDPNPDYLLGIRNSFEFKGYHAICILGYQKRRRCSQRNCKLDERPRCSSFL